MCGQPLKHRCGRLTIVNAIRNLHQAIGWDYRELSIAAEHARVGDAIPRLECRYVLAHGFDAPGSFLPENKRQWRLIAPFAIVDVDEIDTDCCNLHQNFVRLGGRSGQVRVVHHFRAASLDDLNGFLSGSIKRDTERIRKRERRIRGSPSGDCRNRKTLPRLRRKGNMPAQSKVMLNGTFAD